ncbi:MAG: 2',3'-cyclic-nucleotide 2'-phosphodiesterase (5'-nucleotidase family) [Flavobacteriales bacterium]|jgi:2',3'-cyclic-nucleotide 2'-phosphodiesterase (5'-nucleotidase family)
MISRITSANSKTRRAFLKNASLAFLSMSFLPKTLIANYATYPFNIIIANALNYNHPEGIYSKIKFNPSSQLLFYAGNLIRGNSKKILEVKKMVSVFNQFHAIHFGPQELKLPFDFLSDLLTKAKQKTIISNYRFANLALENNRIDYQIIHFNNQKIGIFGLGNNPSLYLPENQVEKIEFLDIIESSKRMEFELKNNQNCNQIVCFSSLFRKGPQNEIVALLYRELNFTVIIETEHQR